MIKLRVKTAANRARTNIFGNVMDFELILNYSIPDVLMGFTCDYFSNKKDESASSKIKPSSGLLEQTWRANWIYRS